MADPCLSYLLAKVDMEMGVGHSKLDKCAVVGEADFWRQKLRQNFLIFGF